MTSRARQARVFARLALLAALLLATVPTIGRLCAPAASHAGMPMAAMAMPHAMPVMPDGMGPASVGHAPHGPHRHPAPHDHDVDCAYCPLASATLLAPLLVPSVAVAIVPAPPLFRVVHTAVPFRLLGTLGSRGPPRQA